MSVKALTWAFEQPISGNDKVVLLSLADHANDYGECWPSIKRLSQRARVSVRTVQRCLAELETAKLIVRETRNDPNGRSTSNMYLLCMGEQARTPAEASGGQRKQEGVKLAPYDGDADGMGEGVSSDRVEGVNGVTLIRTVIKNPHKETSNISYDAGFEEFWEAYPKRPGNSKKDALKAYTKVCQKLNVPHQDIMVGVKAYAAYREGEPSQYTKTAAAWLNGWMWESDWTISGNKTEPKVEKPEAPSASDADMDAVVAKYPGVVSDRATAQKALAAELAKGVALDDIVKAAEKFKLYIKQMKNLGTMVAPPILEVWIKFKWREMDAYYIYRNPVERYPVLKPVKVKK